MACLAVLGAAPSAAQQAGSGPGQSPGTGSARAVTIDSATAASQIADFFGSIGDRIFKDCIFDLSEEQIEVQAELVKAYVASGATEQAARRLAAAQITPPKLSPECERLKGLPGGAAPLPGAGPAGGWGPSVLVEKPPRPPQDRAARPAALPPSPPISLTGKAQLPLWDCAPGIDFVSIHHNGYERKLSGGEICSPFQDIVHEVPTDLARLKLGYVIRTGRLFVIAEGHPAHGQTIAWGLSGRDVCRNNPDPDCLATRAVGPLPPGEYTFARDKAHRVTWGPKTKRLVAAVYLSKLWHRERFSARHTAAILARGNIAIHVRLKGEMSEACIGLEPKGWQYVSGLIRDARATGLDVHIDEPHPRIAGNPPIITQSTFSLSSLFK